MARPYKRDDGRWEVRYRDLQGKWRSVYGRTSKECGEKLRTALNQRDAGKLPAHTTITLGEFLDLWLHDVVQPARTANTYNTYRTMTGLLATAIGKTVKLKDLRPHQIQHAYTEIGQTHSTTTVHTAHATLRNALKTAMAWDMITTNPTAHVTPPRNAPTTIHPFTHEEAQALLETTRDSPYHLVWLTLIQTGLRIAELGGLLWPQVDTGSRTIHVTHMLEHGPDGWHLVQRTKTPKSRRQVKLSPDLASRLTQRRADQLAGRIPTNPNHPYVFTRRDGAPFDRGFAHYHLQQACRLAGLEPRSPHALRHTCATLLLTRDVNPKFVQELLGHSSIQETLDTYSHYLPSIHGAVATTMEDLFAEENTVRSTVRADGRTLRALD